MNLFNNDYENNIRPDMTDPVPNRGLKRFLFIFSNHFTRLLSLNLLFLLFCLPLVTIPASLCALTRVLMILYHTGSCSPWQDFFGELRRCFFSRFLAVFLMVFFPISLCLWFFSFGLESFGVGVSIVLIPVCTATLCYFTAYSASRQAPADSKASFGRSVSADVQRAFFSVFRHPKKSLMLLLAPALLYAAAFYYLPYSMLFLVFIVFSGGQLGLCCILEDFASPCQ